MSPMATNSKTFTHSDQHFVVLHRFDQVHYGILAHRNPENCFSYFKFWHPQAMIFPPKMFYGCQSQDLSGPSCSFCTLHHLLATSANHNWPLFREKLKWVGYISSLQMSGVSCSDSIFLHRLLEILTKPCSSKYLSAHKDVRVHWLLKQMLNDMFQSVDQYKGNVTLFGTGSKFVMVVQCVWLCCWERGGVRGEMHSTKPFNPDT